MDGERKQLRKYHLCKVFFENKISLNSDFFKFYLIAVQPPEPALPLLSDQLSLDDLWDTLGECLTELAKTTDSHAVLVLQPAVEAFFLVHGSEKTTPPPQTPATQETPRASLSSDMLPPPSPGPVSPGALSPSRQMSVSSVTSDLPTDTQKFLKFAGKCV